MTEPETLMKRSIDCQKRHQKLNGRLDKMKTLKGKPAEETAQFLHEYFGLYESFLDHLEHLLKVNGV